GDLYHCPHWYYSAARLFCHDLSGRKSDPPALCGRKSPEFSAPGREIVCPPDFRAMYTAISRLPEEAQPETQSHRAGTVHQQPERRAEAAPPYREKSGLFCQLPECQ